MVEEKKDEQKPVTGRGTGQAITYQSLLQYLLMVVVGIMGYYQNEASKSAAWARKEVVEARKEASADRDKAATERQSTWLMVVGNTETMKHVLDELTDARKDQKAIKADVARVQATGDSVRKELGATQKTVTEMKKAVESQDQ